MRTVPRPLAELRLLAERSVRADDWGSFVELIDRLRSEDPAWWPHLWGPCAALATQHTGGDGIGLLEESIGAGFRDVDIVPLAETFGGRDEWPRLLRMMQSPAPAPNVTLTQWPTVTYGPTLALDALDGEEADRLRQLVPEPKPSAWDTAQELLRWTTSRWDHANDHVEARNALVILERVSAGERFACLEYSVVLGQALNAVGIPARRLSLYKRDSHVGVARGHVVTEAWIDDLNRWVLLDGQNGAWWGSVDHPLGWTELHEAFRSGAQRAELMPTVREIEDPAQWWDYFDGVNASGLVWGDRAVPLFQGEPVTARLLARADAVHHLDLSQLETGLADAGRGPAVTFDPVHPYATGVSVGGEILSVGEPFELDRLRPSDGSSVSEALVSTMTPYGVLEGHPLRLAW